MTHTSVVFMHKYAMHVPIFLESRSERGEGFQLWGVSNERSNICPLTGVEPKKIPVDRKTKTRGFA